MWKHFVTQKALTEADSRSAVNLPLHCEWPPSLCPRGLACGKHGQRHGALHCQHGVPDPDVDLRLDRDHGAAKQKRHEWRTSDDREMHGNRWSSWCSAGMLLLCPRQPCLSDVRLSSQPRPASFTSFQSAVGMEVAGRNVGARVHTWWSTCATVWSWVGLP